MLKRPIVIGLLAASSILALGGCEEDSDSPGDTMPGDVTMGDLRGAVLDNRTLEPIVGATVTAHTTDERRAALHGAASTDAAGRFLVEDLPVGDYDLIVDATGIFPEDGNDDIHYTDIVLHATVVAGAVVDIEHPVFLPRIDESRATQVDVGAPASVQPVDLPGLAMDIEADAATFPNGEGMGRVSIVDIPIDRAPMSMPPATAPALLISIQPAGTTFDPPAQLRLPNAEGLPAGYQLDILSMDPDDGEFKLAARGQVSQDGQTIEPIPGTGAGGITAASWHAPICDAHVVTGRVVDAKGTPVAGATVKILSGFNSATGRPVEVPGGRGVTGADGTYSIPDVRVCEIRIEVVASGSGGTGVGRFDDGLFADTDGTTDVPDIVVNLASGIVAYTLEGFVRFTDDTVVPGAQVFFFGQGRGLQSAVADAAGQYTLSDILGFPGEDGFVASSSPDESALGQAIYTVPSSSGTVMVDVTLCTEDDFLNTCPVTDWELDGTDLILQAIGALPCTGDFDDTPEIEVLGLTNGVMQIMVQDNDGDETLTFERVGGSGPSGISSANLVGVYRQTAAEPPSDDIRLISLFANGDFGVVDTSDDDDPGDYEAGTYTTSGNQITVTPTYSSDGPLDDPFTATFTANSTTFTVDDGKEVQTFTRCESTAGSGIQGLWLSVSDDEANVLMIGDGEWASGSYEPEFPTRDAGEVVVRLQRSLNPSLW